MEKEQKHSKAKWASIIGVSRSGYYSWLRERELRKARLEAYEARVKQIFDDGRGHYGAERICGVIRLRGERASFPVVKRIMATYCLVYSHCRKKQRSLTDSRRARGDEYMSHLEGLEINRPFQVLSSDITYIRTNEGFDYLCQIRDVFTNVVLGHSQQARMTKDLVLKTLTSIQNRWHCPPGTIFHSDRGGQYTALDTQRLIASFGWQQSYSRVGKPGDNAWSESFFANLKKEIVHWNHFTTREEARYQIFTYIETYYNRKRVQKRLGYLSPIDYLNQWTEKQTANLNVA
jgi:putative transposase